MSLHFVRGMICALAVWTCAAFPAAAEPMRYDGQQIISVEVRTPAELAKLQALNVDIQDCIHHLGRMDVRVTPQQKAAVAALGLPFKVEVKDVQRLIELERPAQRGATYFEDYHPYAEILTYMDDLVATYPELVSIIDIGDTLEGRSMLVLRITGGGEGTKPGVFFHGGQHCREWITVPVQLYIATHLLENYGVDPTITELVDRIEWFIMPVLNVDGYIYTWEGERLWRKNRRNNGNGTWGVDLNRNWGFGWGGEGASTSPSSETYRGTGPFSEPETQRVRDFFFAHTNIRAYIDFHSYSQLILWPWGWTADLPPDNDGFSYIGLAMQQTILGVHGQFYTAGPVYTTIYPASGGASDWAYGQQGVWGFSYELRPTSSSPGFLLPPEEIIPTSEEILPAALLLADWATTAVRIEFPDGQPSYVEPGAPTALTVRILPQNENVNPATPTMHYRARASHPFAPIALTPLGGDLYEALLPAAACGETPQYYVSAAGDGGSTTLSPAAAPVSYYEHDVVIIDVAVYEDFEVDTGWTTEVLGATAGQWQRGVPVDDSGWAYDPATDGDGSGQCWLTQNELGNTDVDSGSVRLNSPAYDLTDGDPIVRYAYFLRLTDASGADWLKVEANTGGGSLSWVEVARHTSDGGLAWRTHEITAADLAAAGAPPSADMRFRFTATDASPQSIVEAGLDAFEVVQLSCPVQEIAGDLDGDGDVDLVDFSTFAGCFSGPGVSTPPGGCAAGDFAGADLDGDGDVDLADLSTFSTNYTG